MFVNMDFNNAQPHRPFQLTCFLCFPCLQTLEEEFARQKKDQYLFYSRLENQHHQHQHHPDEKSALASLSKNAFTLAMDPS